MNLIDLMASMRFLKDEASAREYFSDMGVEHSIQGEIIRCYNFEKATFFSVCSFRDAAETKPDLYNIELWTP